MLVYMNQTMQGALKALKVNGCAKRWKQSHHLKYLTCPFLTMYYLTICRILPDPS